MEITVLLALDLPSEQKHAMPLVWLRSVVHIVASPIYSIVLLVLATVALSVSSRNKCSELDFSKFILYVIFIYEVL